MPCVVLSKDKTNTSFFSTFSNQDQHRAECLVLGSESWDTAETSEMSVTRGEWVHRRKCQCHGHRVSQHSSLYWNKCTAIGRLARYRQRCYMLSALFVPLLKKVFTSTMRIWYSFIVSIVVFELNKVPVKCKSCVVRLFTDSFA